jgi:hypothetical protein
MSYLTAPNDLALIPRRISVSARSTAVGDREIQQLARHDIQAIVSRHPDLKPDIAAAYRDAPAAGRLFIEATLGELDPALLASLRSSSQRP